MSSEAATQVFNMLDADGDGKLTPEELTHDFDGFLLTGINAISAAAPLFNEIREKDYQIAYLQAQIAKLEGVAPYKPLETGPEFEILPADIQALVEKLKPGSGPPERWLSEQGEQGAKIRGLIGKLTAVGMKLLVKLFLTIVDIPIIKEHGKDSYFVEMKARAVKFHKDVVDILRPVLKAMPKGDLILGMLDKIFDKMAVGDFGTDRKAFTDALFTFIDVDADGITKPAEWQVYTDLFFKVSVDDAGAKAKLMAIFNSLDLDKSGCLSKDELSTYLKKFTDVWVAYALLLIAYVEVAVNELADKAIKETMEFYTKYRVEYDFKKEEDMEKIDIAEFNILCKSLPGPQFLMAFMKDTLKNHMDADDM